VKEKKKGTSEGMLKFLKQTKPQATKPKINASLNSNNLPFNKRAPPPPKLSSSFSGVSHEDVMKQISQSKNLPSDQNESMEESNDKETAVQRNTCFGACCFALKMMCVLLLCVVITPLFYTNNAQLSKAFYLSRVRSWTVVELRKVKGRAECEDLASDLEYYRGWNLDDFREKSRAFWTTVRPDMMDEILFEIEKGGENYQNRGTFLITDLKEIKPKECIQREDGAKKSRRRDFKFFTK